MRQTKAVLVHNGRNEDLIPFSSKCTLLRVGQGTDSHPVNEAGNGPSNHQSYKDGL